MYILNNPKVITYIDYAPQFNGINVPEFGEETVEPRASRSAVNRSNFIVHFGLAGEGVFTTDGKEYRITSGKAFLITPKNLVKYESAGGNWTYCWIALSGTDCETLFEQCGFTGKAVFDYEPEDIAPLLKMNESLRNGSYCRNASVFSVQAKEMCYNVFANCAKKLRTETPKQPALSLSIIDTAVTYMRRNLHKPLNITELCNELHISRTYFSTLFEESLKQSPYQYLKNLRIQNASEMLLNDCNLHVCEIAEMVGFSSSAQFCKAFKKVTGLQPSEFRKKYLK